MPLRSNRRDLLSVFAQLRGELRRCRREIEDLQGENEILREAAEPLIHQAPARERFPSICAVHRDDHFALGDRTASFRSSRNVLP